jgi:post-segregation antitoxin (ccd killing protein)
MFSTWEDARELGQAQGRTEARARDVLTVLRARGIRVSIAARKRILTEQDLEQLDRWLQKASVATSLADVLEDRGAPVARAVSGRRRRPGTRGSSRGRA